MIAKLAGLALDARWSLPAHTDPQTRASAARWIAANALAAGGMRSCLDGTPPTAPRVFALHAAGLTCVLAALAVVPSLVDATSLPRRWWLALRALGIPALEGAPAWALDHGASVLTCGPGSWDLSVDHDALGYRVRVESHERMLVA